MSNQGQGATSQKLQNADQQVFKKGDLVWAKVRGYSWWPGKIAEVIKERSEKERKYKVVFMGDNTHQTLPQDKVVDFVDNHPKFSQTKKKDLLDSIEEARKQLKKEDQAILDKKGQSSSENSKKQMEKGGIAEKDGGLASAVSTAVTAKNEAASGDKLNKAVAQIKQSSQQKHPESAGQVSEEASSPNSKARGIGQSNSGQDHHSSGSHLQNQQQQQNGVKSQTTSDSSTLSSKNSSVKKPEEPKAVKGDTPMNKRIAKGNLKEAEKAKKQDTVKKQPPGGSSPQKESDDEAAPEEESSDEDEGQIICTKSNKGATAVKQAPVQPSILTKRQRGSTAAAASVPGKASVERESIADKLVDKDTEASYNATSSAAAVMQLGNQKPSKDQQQESSKIDTGVQQTEKEDADMSEVEEVVKVDDSDCDKEDEDEEEETKEKHELKLLDQFLDLPQTGATRLKRHAHQEAQKFIKEHTSKGHKDPQQDSLGVVSSNTQQNHSHQSKATPSKKTLTVTSTLAGCKANKDKAVSRVQGSNMKKSLSYSHLQLQGSNVKQVKAQANNNNNNSSSDHHQNPNTSASGQQANSNTNREVPAEVKQKQRQLSETISSFRQITKKIKQIVKIQQSEEEQIRKSYELGLVQVQLASSEAHIRDRFQEIIPSLSDSLMQLFKTEVCIEALIESGIAKTLKYLQDYGRLYLNEIPEMKQIVNMSDQILQKWKNYVMTTIFDDKKDYLGEFSKQKFLKQAEKKLKKDGASAAQLKRIQNAITVQSISSTNTSGVKAINLAQGQIDVNASTQGGGKSMLYQALMKCEGDVGDDPLNRSANERSNSICYNRTMSGCFMEDQKQRHSGSGNQMLHDQHTESNDSVIEMSAENLVHQQILTKKMRQTGGASSRGMSPNKMMMANSFQRPPQQQPQAQLTLNKVSSTQSHEQNKEYFNSIARQIQNTLISDIQSRVIGDFNPATSIIPGLSHQSSDPILGNQQLLERMGQQSPQNNSAMQQQLFQLLIKRALEEQLKTNTMEKLRANSNTAGNLARIIAASAQGGGGSGMLQSSSDTKHSNEDMVLH